MDKKDKYLPLYKHLHILLPLALLLLVTVNIYTTVAYRNVVVEEVVRKNKFVNSIGKLIVNELERSYNATERISSLEYLFRESPIIVILLDSEGRTIYTNTLDQDFRLSQEFYFSQNFIDKRGKNFKLIVDTYPPATLYMRKMTILVVTSVISVTGVVIWLLFFLHRILTPFEKVITHIIKSPEHSRSIERLEYVIENFLRQHTERSTRNDSSQLVEYAQTAFILCDARGIFLVANQKGRDLFPKLKVNTPIESALPEPILHLVQRSFKDQTRIVREEVTISGNRFMVSIDILKDRDRIKGFLILIDTLSVKEIEVKDRTLESVLFSLGEMAAGVAHELRNGLTTLKGYIQLLAEEADEKLQHYIEEILKEERYLEKVVSDFLIFSTTKPQQRKKVDIGKTISNILLALNQQKGEIEFVFSYKKAFVRGDEKLLKKALFNLIENALHAASSVVEIEITEKENGVLITIKDDGPGIEVDNLDKIFQPFFSTKREGVGLGLSIARNVITLHGGKIEIRRKDKTTEFQIYLPT